MCADSFGSRIMVGNIQSIARKVKRKRRVSQETGSLHKLSVDERPKIAPESNCHQINAPSNGALRYVRLIRFRLHCIHYNELTITSIHSLHFVKTTFYKSGTLGRTRTCIFNVRTVALYPVELREHFVSRSGWRDPRNSSWACHRRPV